MSLLDFAKTGVAANAHPLVPGGRGALDVVEASRARQDRELSERAEKMIGWQLVCELTANVRKPRHGSHSRFSGRRTGHGMPLDAILKCAERGSKLMQSDHSLRAVRENVAS